MKNLMQKQLSCYAVFGLDEKVLLDKRQQFALKRAFDITFSVLAVIFLSPIFLICVILIKLTSRGPVLYSNYRVGLGERHFRCYKFRSMTVDGAIKSEHAKAMRHQEMGLLYKQKNDPRITRIGKIMRKTSIDELPQFFNVIKGDMSVVGPRPLIPFMLTQYPEFSIIRSMVKPGITGLWQIRERDHNTSARFMINHDIEYVKRFNMALDLKILCATLFVVASGKGAH